MVWIVDHYNHMNVGGLNEHVAYLYPIKILGGSETAVHNCHAEGITQKKQSLLDAEGAEENTTVRMILHCSCHEDRFEAERR